MSTVDNVVYGAVHVVNIQVKAWCTNIHCIPIEVYM